MECSSCQRKINDIHYAAVLTFVNSRGFRVRRYLCRGSDDMGCAEELLGNEVSEILEAVPPLGTSSGANRVIGFPRHAPADEKKEMHP